MSGRDPLTGVELMLVDGNNLLHRESGGAGEGAVRGLLARLQATLRPPLQIIVVLDGFAAPGSRPVVRVSPRLEVRHSGSRSADDLIVQLATGLPPVGRARTIVVSDDRALADRCRTAGCRTQRLAWLQALIRPRGSTTAGGAAPRRAPKAGLCDSEARSHDEPDHEGWRPGRGATRKRGNPRRRPRGERGGANG